MNSDEQAIRDLVSTWLEATKRHDWDTVLSLMADDIVFMVPSQEPFGKEAWSGKMSDARVEGKSDIQEIKVLGEWAWMRQRLTVTVTPPPHPGPLPQGGEGKGVAPQSGKPMVLSGYTLAILRKMSDGKWVLARDANLVMPVGK